MRDSCAVKLWPVKVRDATVFPPGSRANSCTLPLVSVLAVHLTVAMAGVAIPCVSGLGAAVAVAVKVGGRMGVAASGDELGLVPAWFVAETT